MEHEGLEDRVAEGGTASERASRIDHPHQRGGDGHTNDHVLEALQLAIELYEGDQNTHQRTNVEGELVLADLMSIAIRKGHDKEICDVKPDCEDREDADRAELGFLRLVAEQEGQEKRRSEYQE